MLYMSLFHGRDDVYAYRWVNQKTGKAGYSPACENIWKSGICPLPKVKCPQCDHASYSPYTAEAVKKHLSRQTKDVFTQAGARASTMIFTLLETAKANELNPEAYLNHLLTVLPERFAVDSTASIEDLMPWAPEIQQLFHVVG